MPNMSSESEWSKTIPHAGWCHIIRNMRGWYHTIIITIIIKQWRHSMQNMR